MPTLKTNVFLVGIMGVGKTTIARRLARMLGVAAVDVDSYMRNISSGFVAPVQRHG